jgi:hypothetical protein
MTAASCTLPSSVTRRLQPIYPSAKTVDERCDAKGLVGEDAGVHERCRGNRRDDLRLVLNQTVVARAHSLMPRLLSACDYDVMRRVGKEQASEEGAVAAELGASSRR